MSFLLTREAEADVADIYRFAALYSMVVQNRQEIRTKA